MSYLLGGKTWGEAALFIVLFTVRHSKVWYARKSVGVL